MRVDVAVIMGSDSDLSVMSDACMVLDEVQVGYEVTIVSAHRTPERMVEYAGRASDRGIRVIVAGAGGAAHLPGMVAALTVLPVIGVPIRSSSLDGLDSLLSIVQMPRGVPVATVAINGARNAGLLAARIVALCDAAVSERITAYRNDASAAVLTRAKRLEEEGWQRYLGRQESQT